MTIEKHVADIEKNFRLLMLVDPIKYHITALGLIPSYPENQETRDMHERLLKEAVDALREELK